MFLHSSFHLSAVRLYNNTEFHSSNDVKKLKANSSMTHKTDVLLNLFSLIQLYRRVCIWYLTCNNFILLKLVDVYTLRNTPLSKIHNWWIFKESQLFGLYAIVWAVKYFHLDQAGYFTVLHNKDYLKCFYLLSFSIVLAFKWDTLISFSGGADICTKHKYLWYPPAAPRQKPVCLWMNARWTGNTGTKQRNTNK